MRLQYVPYMDKAPTTIIIFGNINRLLYIHVGNLFTHVYSIIEYIMSRYTSLSDSYIYSLTTGTMIGVTNFPEYIMHSLIHTHYYTVYTQCIKHN